jgi:hypothetical protein
VSYGTDIFCYDRLMTGRLASRAEVVAQAVFRRLTTARGTLRDGDEGLVYGLDLLGFVGTVGTDAAIAALPDAIRAECLKDDRVDACDVSVLADRGTDGLVTLLIDVGCSLANEDDVFRLSVSVSNVEVALLGVITS